MKLPTRTRYGIRALLELAENYGNSPMNIRKIAHSESISEKYLGQLMTRLNSSSFLRAVRGSQGGYELTRSPDKISLAEVFNALEGTAAITTECLEDNNYCSHARDCVARELWQQVQNTVQETLNSITLQDLADRSKAKKQ